MDIFPFIGTADKVWITELTLIHKNIRSERNSHAQVIGQSDIKHIMTSLIKTITSVLKASTDIITNILARPIWLAEKLAIMSVWTFKIAVILYIMAVKDVKIYIIVRITGSPIGQAVILVMMYVDTLLSTVIVFIGNIIMCSVWWSLSLVPEISLDVIKVKMYKLPIEQIFFK